MKTTATPLLLGAALFFSISSAHAGFFDDLKSKAKNETEKKAEQRVSQQAQKTSARAASKSPSKSSKRASGGSRVSLGNGPSSDLTSMIKCADLKPENITLGYMGNYTFQNGFKKEKRSGLIKRQKGNLSHGCVLPSLQSRQIAYMEVDTKKFETYGSSNDWTMQCIRSAKPGDGAVSESESHTESVYTVNTLSGKDMMLFCGNSENVTECAEGSNSQRSGAWDKKLKANGKTMLSISAFPSTLAPSGGEKLFCQYYNKKSRVSLFAFEYLRAKG